MADRDPEAEEPSDSGNLFDQLGGDSPTPDPVQPPVPQDEPVATQEVPTDGSESPQADSGDAPPPATRRARWPWVVLTALLVLIVAISWTKVVNTDSYCASCHSMKAAALTASTSVHSEVNCISCHRGQGIRGAIAYIPTAGRELIDQLTPLSVADGVMDPAPCEKCHVTVFTSPLLEGEHPSEGCDSCHGNTTHPPPPSTVKVTAFDPHPATWVQIHGQEAVKGTDTCATCHLPASCMNTCHFKFKSEFPHPRDWIQEHGPAQQEQGAEACTLCHPSTFCASCHGTEIPHAPDWVEEHWRELQAGYPTTPCLTCHVEQDCDRCHALHEVHNQQRIYER